MLALFVYLFISNDVGSTKDPHFLSGFQIESVGYMFVDDNMGLTSFKFSWWAPKDARVLKQSVYWPFKVIQGR